MMVAAVVPAAAQQRYHPALDPQHFPVPRAIQPNVAFWREIFAKYLSSQTVIHDGWHVLQHQQGRSPIRNGFSFDPGACGETNERAARFNRIIVANEREANEGVVEFYRAVPGLPQYVRTHLIRSIASPTDADLLDRYRGRRRTDGVDTSWGRGCKH